MCVCVCSFVRAWERDEKEKININVPREVKLNLTHVSYSYADTHRNAAMVRLLRPQ